ncbi:metal ABC transporter ATP-binding protein, partial [candidate division KSB1 bacterium]
GKTTLLKLLLGMLEPKTGNIEIFGRTPSDAAKLIGYVPQNININENFPVSVKDVAVMGRLGATKKLLHYTNKDYSIAKNALEQVDMMEYCNVRIGEISLGQKQRVFIARALVTEPEILILDEPTASLDPSGQQKLFNILKELNKELTILVVSHNLNILDGYVNKVACINRELLFHDAPHVTTEMLDKTFGFSIEQICPLEELPEKKSDHTGHNHKDN